MKKQLIKSLPFLVLLLLVFNCSSQTENGVQNLPLASLLKVLDITDDDETSKKVKSKSSYTLGQDLSSKDDVTADETEKTVSLEKLGEKYVSDRILLKDLEISTKFEILSSSNLDFEIYLGTSPLKDKADKQERFQDLSDSAGRFSITEKGKKYTVEIFRINSSFFKTSPWTGKYSYSLFLVSDEQQEIKIKKLVEDKKSEYEETVPTEVIEVTDTAKIFKVKFLYKKKNNRFLYRTDQIAYNVEKGDRVFTVMVNKPKKPWYQYASPWYSGTSLFKDKADMENRVIKSFSGFPSTTSFTFPGTYFRKTGGYSDMNYLSLEDKVETVELKKIKISLYVPKADAEIISIDNNFKSIDYILDDRNELVKTYTSNQFTLTGVEEGTVLITEMHPTKDYDDLKNSDFYRFNFYRGIERLTEENIRDRYIRNHRVMDIRKSVKEKIYLYRTGDYSIVFTNYSDEKKLTHKIKVE